jgi:hypothetical protein
VTQTWNQSDLEATHRELLETELIAEIARQANIDQRAAMDLYYRSRLSHEIAKGSYGIQYLSPENLASDLLEVTPWLGPVCLRAVGFLFRL